MVARVNSGKNIRGVLNYNENKVKEGVAECIEAAGFGCAPEELTFQNKLTRFTELTSRNKIAKRTAVHISLSFHPDEKFNNQTLNQIAASYLEKIGFGDQPYLVYRHNDTANTHIHIATVNIRHDGTRIDLHYIGENQSSVARREIEEEFGLIKAEERDQKATAGLKPADLQVADYGKRPTKNEISNIVRTVAKHYRYGNFKEYSDILREFNVLANRGEPGSKMHASGGLVYQLLDKEKGEPVGVPIASSTIYEKPTLKNIEARYDKNRQSRKGYRERVMRTIDLALQKPTDKQSFLAALKAENIVADFKQNDQGYTYGITYIDKTTCCFFNGEDIGKGYRAKAILERLQTGTPQQNAFNKGFVEKLFAETDFSKDFKAVLTGWSKSGALIKAFQSEDGSVRYKAGHLRTEQPSFLAADEKMSRYLDANRYGVHQSNTVIDFLLTRLIPAGVSQPTHPNSGDTLTAIGGEFQSLLQQLWQTEYASQAQPTELLREARKKTRKKRNY